jgi:hypothetical protein
MTETAMPQTCPSCGATVRNDVPWCLQCYADLRPKAAPAPAPEPASPHAPRHAQPVADGGALDEPEPAGGTPALAVDPAQAERLANELVAQLAREDSKMPGWQSRLPTSSSGKAMVAAGAVVLAGVVVLVALTLLGMLV